MGGVAAQARRWGAAAADGFPAKEVRRRPDMPQRADKAAALAEAVTWAAGSRASRPLMSVFATNAMARAAGLAAPLQGWEQPVLVNARSLRGGLVCSSASQTADVSEPGVDGLGNN